MSEQANDQPAAAGVEGPGNAAQTDDIDTEAFDRMEAPDDDEHDGDPPADDAEKDADADEPDKPKAEDEDSEEVELSDGRKVRVPKEIVQDRLRHADYTKKTQELAATRRALEEERTTWESQREESRAALPEEHKRVALLEHRLSEADKELDRPLDSRGLTLRTVDWDAFRRSIDGLPDDDPARATYASLRDRYMRLRDSRIDLTEQLGEAKKDLQTKEEARLTEHRSKADEALRQARQETGLKLKEAGWTAETFAQTVDFARDHLGISSEEMADATDPRVWKLINEAMTSRAEIATLKKALNQKQTADKHAKDQATTPAAKPKGNGGAPRDPATPRGDGLSTEEWRRRRLAQKGIKLA